MARKDIPNALLLAAQAFVDRKYTSQADERQRAMGLAYVTAERTDLAKEIASFAMYWSETLNNLDKSRTAPEGTAGDRRR